MRTETCPYEERVLAACRSGHWNDALTAHFQDCPRCREASRASEWMRTLSDQMDMTSLPNPDLIWVRSQIAAREAADQRALRRVFLGRTLKYGLLSAAATWLTLHWLKTSGIALDSSIRPVAEIAQQAGGNIDFLILVAVGAALLSTSVVTALTHFRMPVLWVKR